MPTNDLHLLDGEVLLVTLMCANAIEWTIRDGAARQNLVSVQGPDVFVRTRLSSQPQPKNGQLYSPWSNLWWATFVWRCVHPLATLKAENAKLDCKTLQSCKCLLKYMSHRNKAIGTNFV